MSEIKSYDVSKYKTERSGDLRRLMDCLAAAGDGFELAGQERINSIRVMVARYARKRGIQVSVRKLGSNTLIVRTA